MIDIKITGGRSNCTGFDLRVEIGGYEKSVKTQNYNPCYTMNEESNTVFNLFFSLTFSLMALHIFFINFLSLTMPQFLLGCVLSFLSCMLLCGFLWTIVNRKSREWHTCQHKTMNLLSSDQTLSMENLKKQSKEYAHCEAGMAAMSCLAFVFYLGIIFIDKWTMSLFGKSYFWLLFVILYFPYAILVSKYISIPVQKFLITIQPSEDKLKESLEVALKVLRIKQLTT